MLLPPLPSLKREEIYTDEEEEDEERAQKVPSVSDLSEYNSSLVDLQQTNSQSSVLLSGGTCFSDVLKTTYGTWDMDSERLGVPRDPRSWTEEHVAHWLNWAIREFSLQGPHIDSFVSSLRMGGKQVCSMSKEDFISRAPPFMGDILWAHLEILQKDVDREGKLKQSPTFAPDIYDSEKVYSTPQSGLNAANYPYHLPQRPYDIPPGYQYNYPAYQGWYGYAQHWPHQGFEQFPSNTLQLPHHHHQHSLGSREVSPGSRECSPSLLPPETSPHQMALSRSPPLGWTRVQPPPPFSPAPCWYRPQEAMDPASRGPDPFSCGSSCWSCSQIRPARASSPGRVMVGSSR